MNEEEKDYEDVWGVNDEVVDTSPYTSECPMPLLVLPDLCEDDLPHQE